MSFKRARTYRKRKPVARKTTKRRRTTTRRRLPLKGTFIDDILFNKRIGKLPRALLNYTFDQFAPTSAKELLGLSQRDITRNKDMEAYGDGVNSFYDQYIKGKPRPKDGVYFRGEDSLGKYYLDVKGRRIPDIDVDFGKIGQYIWNGIKAASELGFTGPLDPAIKIGTKAEKILKELNRELKR